MTNPSAVFRSLIVYAICIPMALILGYVLGTPMQWQAIGTVGVVILILITPLLLRFHHPLMILGWNFSMVVFFLPGAPLVWLPLVAISLGMSILRRALDREYRFISVPQVTWPLLVLAAVVLVTAEATGGIKMRTLGGGDVYGGKRYIFLLAAIAGYFALTAQRIPRHRAGLYVGLFLLGGLSTVMGDIVSANFSSLPFLYYFFPPNLYTLRGDLMITGHIGARFVGASGAAGVIIAYMFAKHGIRGILSVRAPWRLVIFVACLGLSLLGGFRSVLFNFILIFAILFFQEGLHRTNLLAFIFVGIFSTVVIMVPFVRQLPYGVQRAVSFLPISVDPVARYDAESTLSWRLDMWNAVLPQVPKYFLLGKGLALTAEDFQYGLSAATGTEAVLSGDQDPMALAGDYHNGPLSVIIPFGVWGAIAFLWFLWAAVRVLYRNYKYGDPALQTFNHYLFAVFVAKVVMFFLIGGGLYSDMQAFAGFLGFSISLNGGVASPAPEPASQPSPAEKVPEFIPRPRSAFGRAI